MKSYVSIEQKFCPICAKPFNTGNMLLDKRIKDSMEKYTCTGVELCPEHQAMVDSGEHKAFLVTEGVDGRRTGQGFLVRAEAAKHLFNCETAPMNYCSEEVFHKILGAMR